MVVVLGPPGVGKTSVARRIAGEGALCVDTARVQDALVSRVRRGRWPRSLLRPAALVLDGPVWLRGRTGVVELLKELLEARAQDGRKTVVCQCDEDGSVDELIRVMRPGSVAVIGLRFPKGKRGRLRFARRACEEHGAPREAARGTDQLEPWRYERVIETIRRWPDPLDTYRDAPGLDVG